MLEEKETKVKVESRKLRNLKRRKRTNFIGLRKEK